MGEQQQRAIGTLEIRAVDDEQRIFEGIANSASVDSHGTVIEPKGAVYRLPLPLFFHDAGRHSHSKPIGNVIATEVRDGLRWIRAQVPKIEDDGTAGGRAVRDRVDAAWADIKNGLVRGLSIEFLPIEPKSMSAKRWTRWDWRALAVVPVPSNVDATIQLVRSIAESGDPTPGVPGTPTTTTPRRGHMTIQEQIQQHENSRAAKVARKSALMERSAAAGATLDTTEAEEFDTLDSEIQAIDAHLVRLNSLKADNEKRAVAVPTTPGAAPAAQARAGVAVVQVRPNVEPGIMMARHAMALLVSNGSKLEAAEYAKRTWGDSADEIVQGIRTGLMTRAAIAPGTTAQATFAAPLVTTNYANEFLELLRPMTLLGRVPGLRKVPFNTSMPAQTAGGTYKWVGQGKPKPVTNAQYAAVTLGFAKASGIIVLTEELVRLSTPSAEAAVRDEMLKGIQQFLDGQFVDASVAAVANVNPASITNGVTGTAASGTDVSDAFSDIAARVQAMAAAGFSPSELVILMSESQAFVLGIARDANGDLLFPNLGITGGTIAGIPVVASETVGAQIIVAHAASILYADDGGVEIDVSREASVQLDSAPTDPADASTVLTSLWQHNLVGLRAERFITWGKARSTAVDRITSVAYAA